MAVMKKLRKTLDVTKDALFNRLRTGGDQIFPIGAGALVLQRAGELTPHTFSSQHQVAFLFPLAVAR